MGYELKRDGLKAAVTLKDEGAGPNIAELQAALKRELSDGAEEIEFDLASIRSPDAAMICLFIAADNSAARKGGTLCLVNASPETMAVLETLRLTERLNLSGKEA